MKRRPAMVAMAARRSEEPMARKSAGRTITDCDVLDSKDVAEDPETVCGRQLLAGQVGWCDGSCGKCGKKRGRRWREYLIFAPGSLGISQPCVVMRVQRERVEYGDACVVVESALAAIRRSESERCERWLGWLACESGRRDLQG